MKKVTILEHFMSFVFRGLLAAIPLFLSYLVIKFIYVMVDRKVRDSFESWTGFEIVAPGVVTGSCNSLFFGTFGEQCCWKKVFSNYLK